MLCALVCVLTGALPPAARAAPDPSPASLAPPPSESALRDGEELLVAVDLNDQRVAATILVVRDRDARFWAPESTLIQWRLRPPPVPAAVRDGVRYQPLDAIDGLVVRYDPAQLRLGLTAPPAAFAGSAIAEPPAQARLPAPPGPGGFFNYSLLAGRADGLTQWSGLVEAGVFGPAGVVVASGLAQDLDGRRSAVRLDTTYTHDMPARLESLRIGDVLTIAGSWGRSLRVGGVQFGTNFGLQPGFVAYPTITATGQAGLPSTVDVFVNNALVARNSVPPGPFSISNVPTVNGSGNVQLVVRDLQGRETLITQPFYASTDLLVAGLSEYSVEAGALRRNFGTRSNDYDALVGSAIFRHGVTDSLTAEVRAEGMRDQAAAGVGANVLVGRLGVVSGTVAASSGRDTGTGTLVTAGFSRQAERLGITVRTLWAQSSFRLAGDRDDPAVPRRETLATVGYQFGAAGSANVTWIGRRYHDQEGNDVLAFGYTLPVLGAATVSVNALRVSGQDGGWTVGAALTIPFGTYESASAGTNLRRDGDGRRTTETQVQVQRSLPEGPGYGYRLLARSADDLTAGIALQNDVGTYTLEATRFDGGSAVRAGVAGGVGVLGGHAFASRAITESFGVVTVGDYPGVGILFDQQPVARTDADGVAIVPRLRAYDVNRLSIEQQHLPLDAEVESLRLEVVPYYRSGALARFAVRRAHGATLRIVLADGGPLPAGAVVRIEGRDAVFPVGADGEIYLTGFTQTQRARAQWRGQACEFEIPWQASDDPLPALGDFLCAGVAR